MAKKYTRKQVNSISELNLEQERIKNKTRRIEDDMLDIFSPQQLVITLVGKLLSRKAAQPVSRYFSGAKKGKAGKPKTVKEGVMGFVSQPVVKRIAKTIGISFLKWQVFNLALFAGKKIYRNLKEKRQKRRLQPS